MTDQILDENAAASPRVARETPEATGALIVTFHDDCALDDAARLLEGASGRPTERTGVYASRLRDFLEAARVGRPALYEPFRLAVVDPEACGAPRKRIEELATAPEVLSVRPEYMFEAEGWLCRLLGFERPRARAASDKAQPGPGTDATEDEGDAVRETPAVPPTWGVRAVGADVSPWDGAGVKVAVLDTGFDFDHPDFRGREIIAESFVQGETAQDGQGHGTHVAGTVAGAAELVDGPRYGVAPAASLVIGKVLGDSGFGREGDILAGVLWAIEQGCAVINMSLGRRALPGDATGDYDRVGRIALERGCVIVAAAGNESARQFGRIAPVGAPANARSVLAVGAIDEARAVAFFSNGGLDGDGGAIDLCAPGVAVLSSTPGRPSRRPLSGTSMASPHVAGVAALWAQSDPNLRGRALWTALIDAAEEIGLPARDGGAGLSQAPRGRDGGAGVA